MGIYNFSLGGSHINFLFTLAGAILYHGTGQYNALCQSAIVPLRCRYDDIVVS